MLDGVRPARSAEQPVVVSPQITLHSIVLPSPFPSCPTFHFHLTRLSQTLMIWVGAGPPSTPETLAYSAPDERKLAEWAVSMPARPVRAFLTPFPPSLTRSNQDLPVSSTPIFRNGAADLALPLSQRLAKRFPANQILLQLSLPASLTAQSGPSLNPYASKALLVMEKRLGVWLEELLVQEKGVH
ncbi:proteasome assembly chaperone 4, partial [Tremellales sp. Uapishka_1]